MSKKAEKIIRMITMLAVTLILILMAGYEEAEKERRKEQQRQEEIDQAMRDYAKYARMKNEIGWEFTPDDTLHLNDTIKNRLDK